MSKTLRDLTQAVTPGDKLGVVEEFFPGTGTYETGGTIYSSYTGTANIDIKNKRVTVLPATRTPALPREGSTILASVTHTQEKMAGVNIWQINGKMLHNPFSAILRISESSPRYERNMSDVCKAGDIIKARVIETISGVPLLTTAGRGLGVVKAFCSRCGGPLNFSNRRLQCTLCSNVERRRLAEDYGQTS